MNDRAREAQECVHWRGLVGSANPLHTLFDPMTTGGFETKPCGLGAYSSYTRTEAGLALPMCCQVGIETEPRHSMLTVRSSASGGCDATSCPYREG